MVSGMLFRDEAQRFDSGGQKKPPFNLVLEMQAREGMGTILAKLPCCVCVRQAKENITINTSPTVRQCNDVPQFRNLHELSCECERLRPGCVRP